MLLHGLGVTSDINFYRCYAPLAERFRLVAFDHRGHGEGIRSSRLFRFADCADDVVAVADAIGIDRFVPVGYSMGGAIAQEMARRHPARLGGLVLCATASRFSTSPLEYASFAGLGGLAALARVAPPNVRRLAARRYYRDRHTDWAEWALDQTANHDWRAILEAAAALGRFRSDGWLGDVGLPASVVVTLQDSLVPAARQRRLASLLPDVRVFTVDAGHDAIAAERAFAAILIDAIDSVMTRST